MKVQYLLEDEDRKLRAEFEEVAKQYPAIRFNGTITSFITDLPRNITQEQLNKLIHLSFTPIEIKKQIGYASQLPIYILSEYGLQDWIAEITGYGIPSSRRCKTWKEAVTIVKGMYQDTGDFEE